MGLYFEQSWAILSTIGVVNVLYGLVIISITKISTVVLIPIIVSGAGAIANGLCYYAFYSDHPLTNTLVASGFADIFWLVCTWATGPLCECEILTRQRYKKLAYHFTATPY